MIRRLTASLKELIRPYYLKWLYFNLPGNHCPPYFKKWLSYPSVPLGSAPRKAVEPQTDLPDVLFLPMADWHGLTQRSQHLTLTFAESGHRCLYLNPHLGREFPQPPLLSSQPVVTTIAPRILELHVHLPREPVFHHRCLKPSESTIVEQAIVTLLEAIDSKSQIAVVSFPLWDDVAKNLRKRCGTTIVYDCHDLLEGFNNISDDIIESEAEFMRTADLVVFSSEWLAREHIKRMPEIESKSTVIRNAVDPRNFEVCPLDKTGPRTIGYAGALNFWFDVEAVTFAAQSHPEWQFLLVGSVAPSFPRETLKRYPNIQLVGEVPHQDLPRWFAEFDVAIIPFQVQPLILATNPIKLYEYLACGLPIVGPMIPELARHSDLLYLASDSHDFCRQIEAALAEDNQSLRAERRRIAQFETWQSRCELLTRELHSVVADVTARVT